jgi:hypothetical protein
VIAYIVGTSAMRYIHPLDWILLYHISLGILDIISGGVKGARKKFELGFKEFYKLFS